MQIAMQNKIMCILDKIIPDTLYLYYDTFDARHIKA